MAIRRMRMRVASLGAIGAGRWGGSAMGIMTGLNRNSTETRGLRPVILTPALGCGYPGWCRDFRVVPSAGQASRPRSWMNSAAWPPLQDTERIAPRIDQSRDGGLGASDPGPERPRPPRKELAPRRSVPSCPVCGGPIGRDPRSCNARSANGSMVTCCEGGARLRRGSNPTVDRRPDRRDVPIIRSRSIRRSIELPEAITERAMAAKSSRRRHRPAGKGPRPGRAASGAAGWRDRASGASRSTRLDRAANSSRPASAPMNHRHPAFHKRRSSGSSGHPQKQRRGS